jgi:arylsulfatase
MSDRSTLDGACDIPTHRQKSHRFHVRNWVGRPNILLLMTDQQRFDTVGAAGYSHMHTPNLDCLASEGTLFPRAYSPNPICLAARHNLLTGRPARFHGIPDNASGALMHAALPTLPRILSDNGYDTRAIGKMHFRPARRHNGFLKMELMEELPNTREEDEYATYLRQVGLGHVQNIHGVRNLLYMLPQRSLIPEEHHGTKWVADRTIDYLQANRGRQPFFLWASWIAPHPPFDIVDRYAELYRDAELPQPYISRTPLPRLAEENAMLGDLPDARYLRRMREVYYAAISMVDEQVGRILDTLRDIGQLDNTVIIFCSDHGELLGDYGIYQKWLPYDSCARIPFIIRYPERTAPASTVDDFVDLNDIMPTVLDVAGLNDAAGYRLPGESLFSAKPNKDRQWQYVEYAAGNRRWISIRNNDHKYNYYYGGGFEQLFDLRRDPHETTNLLHEDVGGQVEDIRASLREKLLTYEQEHGLVGYTTRNDFKKGEPYEPHPQRNEAYQRFILKIMDEPERRQMNTLVDEIILAVKKEPVVRLRELDLESWRRNLEIPDDEFNRLLDAEDLRHPNHSHRKASQ